MTNFAIKIRILIYNLKKIRNLFYIQFGEPNVLLLVLGLAWLHLLRRVLNKRIQSVRHTDSWLWPSAQLLHPSNHRQLHLVSQWGMCTLNYPCLQNQEMGPMQKPVITVNQSGINIEHIITCVYNKVHVWLQSVCILSVVSHRRGFKHAILNTCMASWSS